MSRTQLETFLETAALRDPRWHPLWLCLGRAALRLGEALALEWRDLDFTARELRVTRTLADGGPATPKSWHGRTVDMSQQLADVLRHLRTERKAETLRRGWRAMPSLVFCSEACSSSRVKARSNVQRQLGHGSIKLTVDSYGGRLPMGNKAAVDRLDGRSGSQVVANAVASARYRTSRCSGGN